MRIVIVGAALIVPVALVLAGCSGEDSRPDNLGSIVHDGSDAAVAPAPTTGATAVEATEETVAPATADVPAYLGCEQIHECVLDDFVDIWDGYNGIHSPEDALGRINLYFYRGAIYPDDKACGVRTRHGSTVDEAEMVLPRIERRTGVRFTGELHIMIYENWNAMKHFAPDPDVELLSLILGRDTLVINHDHRRCRRHYSE